MSGNTATNSDDTLFTPTAGAVAGVFTILAAIGISFGAVLIGEGLTYGQTTTPVIGGGLWPLSAGLTIAFTLIAGLFTLMVVLGLIGAVATPELLDRTEYTLIGIGGMIGTALATITSTATWITDGAVLGGSLPTGSGESLAVLAAVALPFTYVFYQLYTPDMTPISAQQSRGETLDPEFVRQKTERRTDMAAATPAKQQQSNTGNSQNQAEQQSPVSGEGGEVTTDSEHSGTTDDQNSDWSEMEYRWVTETDVNFDDVGGMADLKRDLQEDVVMPLVTNPEKAAELGVDAPNIIFHGPPGTGKTYMAKALATELGLPFAKLSGADLQSKWINESAQKVNTLFDEAMTVADEEGGAVVFLDELDSVLKDRTGSANSHEEDKKVVNEFLNHLEDTGDHNVVFIGATNRLDSLDEAGIRSGRIDKKVHVGKPDEEARASILKAQLNNRPHTISDEEIQQGAELTSGLVAADLELVVKKAAKSVLVRDGEGIQWQDLQGAVQEVQG